jgi:Plasmid pRiA4b ORF-3-like protein
MFFFGPADYTLLVELEGVEPIVWRRLKVPAELPLATLAKALEIAMGWGGHHLHQFEVAGLCFGEPSEDFDVSIDYTSIVTKQILPRVESEANFAYDFGDDWHHVVRVEAATERPEGADPSIELIEGAMACPPDDCGGFSGYADLLEALGDPSHEEHASMKEWVRKAFRFDAFEVEPAQRALDKLLPKKKPVKKQPPRKVVIPPGADILGIGRFPSNP